MYSIKINLISINTLCIYAKVLEMSRGVLSHHVMVKNSKSLFYMGVYNFANVIWMCRQTSEIFWSKFSQTNNFQHPNTLVFKIVLFLNLGIEFSALNNWLCWKFVFYENRFENATLYWTHWQSVSFLESALTKKRSSKI